MEAFVEKLIDQSDQWITKNAINDKEIFQSAVQTVFDELPSPLKQHVCSAENKSKIVTALWEQIQEKYRDSSNEISQKYFYSDVDIDEHLTAEALQSSKASVKHYFDHHSTLTPFFKSYHKVGYKDVNDVLDILSTDSSQCNDEWFSLILHRFNQFLSTAKPSKSQSKKIRLLSQKLYRLFCCHIGNKYMKEHTKQNEALLFNQIVLICQEDKRFCTDRAMNVLSFIRVFFEYIQENGKVLEAMKKCVNIKTLFTELFVVIMNRYDALRAAWSNTQQLLFLWTLYECNQLEFISNQTQLSKLLAWCESVWQIHSLNAVFGVQSIDSFASFVNEIYKHNLLSTVHAQQEENEEDDDDQEADYDDFDEDDDEYGDDDGIDDADIMDLINEASIIENINDVKDEDLFIVDTGDSVNDVEDNMDVAVEEQPEINEPPTKKMKL
eukprot:CAMPEP_0197028076 /NCGR_PEP_ID=MMETSP1384-20130603/7866_1 /TAXON_ID=29189 /ORGANISM="Ammonia sp." /LENGTH=438 /DNA_ID=CAMNT_0042457019 /DNA_START=35 /DNA_END=1351 /DNA_ORIENTATION=+